MIFLLPYVPVHFQQESQEILRGKASKIQAGIQPIVFYRWDGEDGVLPLLFFKMISWWRTDFLNIAIMPCVK